MGGTAEDAGSIERAERLAIDAAANAHAIEQAKKFAKLEGATEALRLATAELDAACVHIGAIAALAQTLARMGIVAGKVALLSAGVPTPAVELAGRLAEAGVEKARGRIAGA